MPHAVLAVALGPVNTMKVQGFSLSGPDKLTTLVDGAIEHAGGYVRDDDNAGAGGGGERYYSLRSGASPVKVSSLLNWIESSGWTLHHVSTNTGVTGSSGSHTYVFKDN